MHLIIAIMQSLFTLQILRNTNIYIQNICGSKTAVVKPQW